MAPAQGEQVFCVEMNLMAPASSLMALRILLRVWQANRQLDRRAGKKALQLAPATSQVART